MLALVLIVLTLAVIVAALARAYRMEPGDGAAGFSRDGEEARVAKYRELRELELDWQTGKLSDADYRQARGRLRAEAATLLERMAE